jgi:flagellin FlaB
MTYRNGGTYMAKANRKIRIKDEDAEMGIGTMIVFIAMVMVAAMAAGVLLQTAGLVQQQAQETGTRAVADVSTGFIVQNILGDRLATPTATSDEDGAYEDTIQWLEIKIALASGSPDIAMSNVIIEISDGDTDVTLSWHNETAQAAYQNEWDAHNETDSQLLKQLADATTFTAEELRDPDETYYETSSTTENDNPDYVVSPGCIIRIFINTQSSVSGLHIDQQDHIFMKIIPKHGVPTYETFTCPEAFTERYVELQ